MSNLIWTEKSLDKLFFDSIEDGDEIVFESKEYSLDRTLNIKRPITISGNGAHLKGNGPEYGIMVYSGDTTIKDLKITGVPYMLEVDPFGKTIEHIVIDNIDGEVLASGIQAASSRSNGILRDIRISNCSFHGADTWEGSGLSANLPITVYAAAGRNDGTTGIRDCLAEHIY